MPWSGQIVEKLIAVESLEGFRNLFSCGEWLNPPDLRLVPLRPVRAKT